jgi:hypothetical protein
MAPPESGTTLWRDRQSGRCVARAGAVFSRDTDSFEQVFTVENRFNRLALFRENVLHRPGFFAARQRWGFRHKGEYTGGTLN